MRLQVGKGIRPGGKARGCLTALAGAAALVGLAALAAAFWEIFATCAALALCWLAARKFWRALDKRLNLGNGMRCLGRWARRNRIKLCRGALALALIFAATALLVSGAPEGVALLGLACALLALVSFAAKRLWRALDRRFGLNCRLRPVREWLRRNRRNMTVVAGAVLLLAALMALFRPDGVLSLVAAAALVWLALRAWRRYGQKRLRNVNWKSCLRDLSIQKAYVFYVVVAMASATVIWSTGAQMVDSWRMEIYWRYEEQARAYEVPLGGYVVTDEVGGGGRCFRFTIEDADHEPVESFTVDFDCSEVTYSYLADESGADATEWDEAFNVVYVKPRYSETDLFLDRFAGVMMVLSFPVVYIGAIALCAMLFFRRKLREPIGLLSDAAGKIAENSLDFHIAYAPRDEMGALCDAFERMRAALAQNNAEMWRQMEERRRLNAAFSHDLRTPLTVLKGHAELLRDSIPDETVPRAELLQEVEAMSAHVARLENYVAAMSRLQRLEDVEIHAAPVPAERLARELREAGEILCAGKAFSFAAQPALYWHVDVEAVVQVGENLLSNAARYARTRVTMCVEARGGALEVCVADDGCGFTPDGLEKATEPFYRAEGSGEGHLGLGLNICRILCERHGGGVSVENGEDGGAVVRARFALGWGEGAEHGEM